MKPYKKEFYENFHRIPDKIGVAHFFIGDKDREYKKHKKKKISEDLPELRHHLQLSIDWIEENGIQMFYIISDEVALDVKLQGFLLLFSLTNYQPELRHG